MHRKIALILFRNICIANTNFILTVTSSSKKTDDSAVSKAAVDHEPKFRCKFLDCSKSFRKAKLLHYHMKYFHGIEKSPEPQQSPGTRNIQTRSLASEKASQEGSNRRRTTSGCLCKYFANRLLLNIFFSFNSSGYSSVQNPELQD